MKSFKSIHTRFVWPLSMLVLLGMLLSVGAGAATEFQLIQSMGKREGSAFGKLIKDASGNFFGTTVYGGLGFGTVFKIDASGNFSVVHEFDGESGGAYPDTGVILGNDGNLYGTTYYGSSNNYGAAFKLDPAGNFTVLHEFNNGSPHGELIQASDGNFYGTTYGCDFSDVYGSVFKMDPSGNFTVLFEFDGSTSGSCPNGLIQGSDGSFYGTTSTGGSYDQGTIFKIDTSGNFSELHEFNGNNGSYPSGELIQGSDGSFYGTTSTGGSTGYGTVFKLDASGNFSVVHDFEGGAAGANPGMLILGSDGNFYGAATGGGLMAETLMTTASYSK